MIRAEGFETGRRKLLQESSSPSQRQGSLSAQRESHRPGRAGGASRALRRRAVSVASFARTRPRRLCAGDAAPGHRDWGPGDFRARWLSGLVGLSSPPSDRGWRTPPCGLHDRGRTGGGTAGTRASQTLPVPADRPDPRRSRRRGMGRGPRPPEEGGPLPPCALWPERLGLPPGRGLPSWLVGAP